MAAEVKDCESRRYSLVHVVTHGSHFMTHVKAALYMEYKRYY